MKVALVHDWLTGMRGGEKVLEALCEIFPEADLYTLVYIPGSVSPIIEKRKIFTSFIQFLPDVERRYRYYLPLMPKAIEKFDLSKYDLIISVSHCVAKGVIPKDDTLHICYCLTPMRYVWDMYDAYFGGNKSNLLTRMVMSSIRPYLQRWDKESASRVDYFIADSENVRKRIQNYYHRDAEVIYPPVDTNFFVPDKPTSQSETAGRSGNYKKLGDYYLIVSAFAPYKRVDLAIEAFNQLGYSLKIVGNGQEEKKLKKLAKANIEFLGWLSQDELRKYYQKCKALIFPGEEDFGIVPVEAISCGKPVIAYGKGGALETVTLGLSGIFFYQQTTKALVNVINQFERMKFDEEKIRNNALRFSREIFKEKIRNFVEEKYYTFKNKT